MSNQRYGYPTLSIVLFWVCLLSQTAAFERQLHHRWKRIHPNIRLHDSLSPFYDDFEDMSMPTSSSKSDQDWFDALKRRQRSIEKVAVESSSSARYLQNWKSANCASTVRLSLDDWIRRMAIENYPLAVCGSASGHIYLADLQQGQALDCIQDIHSAQLHEDDSRYTTTFQNAMNDLYGRYDGGGVIALAIKGDIVASAGREGGVHIATITGEEEDLYKGSRGGIARQTKLSLKREGFLRGLENSSDALITSLAFDASGTLWVGGYDGNLMGYDAEEMDADNRPMLLRQKYPMFETNLNSPILSISINDDIGCGVGCTRGGGIFIFSTDDGQVFATWKPVGKRDEFFRTAIIVQNDPDPESIWSIVCGGSEGSVFQRALNVDILSRSVSDAAPFRDMIEGSTHELPSKLRPNHQGSVLAMASPFPGLLVTGAQDGNVRVWDCSSRGTSPVEAIEEEEEETEAEAQYDDVGASDNRPRCLYAMTGYKVWLGSIFAGKKKLVSDGADNTIIVHSFDGEEDMMLRDDDEEGGFAYE
eukprot:CAMPEP_0113637276 /NCGR_PEP_ID=MMETSP0017_2-20120614/19505_1 /TAXON_ID=2856 /ORGANISM="Cylindrotheca closterium" /LENGTH=532 /DNA_ID=CAMNT_0000548283 /DNA_START=68 /DNA_END=1666 /DNA_ORIENTATION=+ /assembly_acc=CAM_ASM_000147